MKKLVIKLISTAAVLMSAILLLASAGGQDDPLISLSFLNGEYKTNLVKDIDSHIGKAFDGVYAKAESLIDSGTPLLPPDDYTQSKNFAPLAVYPTQKIWLSQGTQFSVTGKTSAWLAAGGVIDLSTGSATAGSFAPAENRTYFVAENSSLSIEGESRFTLYIDGHYKYDESSRTHHPVFEDVAVSDWFYNAADYAYKNNLFTGTSPTEFSPHIPMTRGMFVTVLYRLSGSNVSGTINMADFPDVSNQGVYYYDPVRWAASNDIVKGFEDGTFRPNDSVTREQMATFMNRYAKLKGENTSYSANAGEDFPDYGSISNYALEPMKWAISQGILSGSDGKLLPRDTATRAQVAQIIMNFATRN